MAIKGRRATREERIRAVRLLANGNSPELVAEFLGVSRSSVFEWQRKYREGGPAALSTKLAPGRPANLSDEQMLALRSLIVGRDPRQLSFDAALWTRKIVRELITQRFAVSVSLSTVRRILRKLGLSTHPPLDRAYQRDPDRVRQWKTIEYTKIRAQAARIGARIFFADEAEAPAVAAAGESRSITMIAAGSPRRETHFDVFSGTMNAERFIEFCQKLRHDVTGPVFLIAEDAGVHTTGLVKQYVTSTSRGLSLFLLPPYSPELAPDNWTWSNVEHDKFRPTDPTRHKHCHKQILSPETYSLFTHRPAT